MAVEAGQQHELGLMNDSPHEGSVKETRTSPPPTGEPELRDSAQKCDPVSAGVLLPDSQIRSESDKARALQILAQCAPFNHPNTRENVTVNDSDTSPKEYIVKNSLPSLPSLTESSEVHFHEKMHNLIVQFSGCSPRFDWETLISSPRDGYDRVELTDATTCVTEGNKYLSSVLIPEMFELNDSTLLKQRSKQTPSPNIMSAPELQSNSSLSKVVSQPNASSVLLHQVHGPDAHNLELTPEDHEFVSEIREETTLPFAATYADAANLAVKYPHLASKILVAPLRPGGSPGALVPPVNDCQVSKFQNSNRYQREQSLRGPPNSHQTRGRRPAIRVEKKGTPSPLESPNKDSGGASRLERKGASGVDMAPTKKVNRRTKLPAGTGDEGGISNEIEGKHTIEGHPTHAARRGNDSFSALQVDERRTPDVWKAIRATAEHSKKESGTRPSLRYSDTWSTSNRAIVNPNAIKDPKKRSSLNLRTDRAITGNAGEDALRVQHRVLGSQVLRSNNLTMTPPYAAEIVKLLGPAMTDADLATDTSPRTTDPSFFPLGDAVRLKHLQFDPIVSPPVEGSLGFVDLSQPNLPLRARKIVTVWEQTRTEQRVRGFSHGGDTSFGPTLGRIKRPSISLDDRSDRYYDEIKLLAYSTPQSRRNDKRTGDSHSDTPIQGVPRLTPVERTPFRAKQVRQT